MRGDSGRGNRRLAGGLSGWAAGRVQGVCHRAESEIVDRPESGGTIVCTTIRQPVLGYYPSQLPPQQEAARNPTLNAVPKLSSGTPRALAVAPLGARIWTLIVSPCPQLRA